MPTIEKSPRDRWPDAARGLDIQLLAGVHGPVEFSGQPDMIIRGCQGAIIEGSINPGGGEPPCAIRVNDGAHRLQILGPLEVGYSDGRGIRITVADDIVLQDLYIHHCGIECIITGDCRRGTYRDILCEDSRATSAGYAPDKRHGIYISGNADGSVVERLVVRRCTGSGLQLNGAGMNAVIESVHASELEFYHVGSGGTPPLSLMACRNCTIEQFCADWTASDRWAVLFDDGKGSNYACYDNTLQTYTVPRGTHPAEEGGSRSNTFSEGAGWAPGPAPEPEPEPEPEPPPENEDLTQALADVETALAAVNQQVVIAYAALANLGMAMDGIERQTALAQEALARAQDAAGGARSAGPAGGG